MLGEINRDPDSWTRSSNSRTSGWRSGRASEQDLGYRRFFDVNTLVGLRVEDPTVFGDTHALILKWLREGVLDGIRVDHPDGLRDPRAVF